MISDVFKFSDLSPTSVSWKIPRSLPYFEGHFPQNPVLPAVAIIDASLHFLCLHLKNPDGKNQQPQIKELISSKFMVPITPDTLVHIVLKESRENIHLIEWIGENKTVLATIQLQLYLRVREF